MRTITEIREMTNEQIIAEMRRIAATLRANTTTEAEEQAMYFTVMSQRAGRNPEQKLKESGYYEKAVSEGWF